MKVLAAFVLLIVLPALVSAGLRIFGARRCFHCNGLFSPCISYSHVCDGDRDCPYGEDERDCPYICPYPHFYRCSDTGRCIDSYQLCNGYPDCDNGEDENRDYCDEYRTLVNRREPVSPLLYLNATLMERLKLRTDLVEKELQPEDNHI